MVYISMYSNSAAFSEIIISEMREIYNRGLLVMVAPGKLADYLSRKVGFGLFASCDGREQCHCVSYLTRCVTG